MTTAVQNLYEACNVTFPTSAAAGALPSLRAVQRLRSVLDTIKPVDVGINEESFENDYGYGDIGPSLQRDGHPTIVAQRESPITYLHVYECDRFSIIDFLHMKDTFRDVAIDEIQHERELNETDSKELDKLREQLFDKIGIFCLPTSAVIPFHDHPKMTVFSKLLFGSMHIKAYDWVNPMDTERSLSQVRLAKLKIDNVFTAPCNTTILYPTSGGNIHSFRAVTSCAVLDVLVPPYSDTAGRDCTYYCEYPYLSLPDDGNTIPDFDSDQGYAWLDEIEKPDDFIVEGAQYKGPLIEA